MRKDCHVVQRSNIKTRARSGKRQVGATSATLASQTPNRMGKVATTTRRGTALPIQADTITCGGALSCKMRHPGRTSPYISPPPSPPLHREGGLQRFDGVSERCLHTEE